MSNQPGNIFNFTQKSGPLTTLSAKKYENEI